MQVSSSRGGVNFVVFNGTCDGLACGVGDDFEEDYDSMMGKSWIALPGVQYCKLVVTSCISCIPLTSNPWNMNRYRRRCRLLRRL